MELLELFSLSPNCLPLPPQQQQQQQNKIKRDLEMWYSSKYE